VADNNQPVRQPQNKPIRLRQPTPCPICAKTSVQKYHPFCSGHCANVDLNRWLSGHYAIPSQEEGDIGADEVERE